MCAIAFLMLATPVRLAAELTLSAIDGGTVRTERDYTDPVNPRSSLERIWWILNDSTCPLQIAEAGITTRNPSYAREGFYATGSAKASADVSAFEVRFLLFDVFGRHMKTLSMTKVEDIQAGIDYPLEGVWDAGPADLSELLTIVTLVSQVRGGDGSVWSLDLEATTEQIRDAELAIDDSSVLLI